MQFVDIGANLLDPMFAGIYHGKRKHDPDLDVVLNRARSAGVARMIVTAGSLSEAREALIVTQPHDNLFTTVGVHPTRCDEFDSSNSYVEELIQVAVDGKARGKVVAVGECGLDYDRLQFCSKQTQLRHFENHFQLTEATNLPMFLHNRNSSADLAEILARNRDRFRTGVVHSFDGSAEELKLFLDLDLYVGINGCSLRTHNNLEVVKLIPADRLMLETDCPWCEIKPTHAGFSFVNSTFDSKKPEKYSPDPAFTVKNRTEPCHIQHVLEVVAGQRGDHQKELARQVYENTLSVFFRE